MKSRYKIVIVVTLIVFIIFGSISLFRQYEENALIKQVALITEAKVKKENLKIQFNKKNKEIAILENKLKVLSEQLKKQKQYPKAIVKKNEKNNSVIDSLSVSESYRLFSTNITKYKSNRERYSLQRFK